MLLFFLMKGHRCLRDFFMANQRRDTAASCMIRISSIFMVKLFIEQIGMSVCKGKLIDEALEEMLSKFSHIVV